MNETESARRARRVRGGGMRAVVVLVVCTLLATACTREPPGGEMVIGFGTGQAPADIEGDPNGVVFDEEFAGDDAELAGDTGASGPGNGGGTGGPARPAAGAGAAPGDAPAAPGSPGATASAGNHGPGVDGGTVKIAFHIQEEACGGNSDYLITEKGYLVISEYVRWFNEEVLGPHGWQLEYEIVDDGGLECPEKAQAAALKIAREIRPFAVLGHTVTNARGPVLQETVTREGIVHIGTNFQTYEVLQQREPYARPTLAVAETAIRDLLGWIEVRVKDTPVPNQTTRLGEERVYGVLGVETAEGRALTRIARDRLVEMGIQPAGVYQISGDTGVAAQHATNLALRMRQDGVNTVVWALPYASIQASIVLTEAMNAQNYLPEVLVGTMGLAFFDQLHNNRVWGRARGTSQLPAMLLRTALTVGLEPHPDFMDLVENADAYERVWTHLGHNDTAQDGASIASGVFQDLGQLATGILHLPGDVLNAQTFAQGLDSATRGQPNRCTVARFMGRDYIYQPTWEWRSSPPYGAKGFTTVYWVNQPSPPLATGRYESYDNYRFFESPADLPPEPSHDTGQDGYDIPKQQFIGLFPWSDCGQWPNFPAN